MTAGNPAEYRMRYQKGGISGRIYCTVYTHSKFLLIFGQPIADYRKMQCGKVLLRISGKLSDQIFGTRIRLDRKYGARPAGRIPIPIGSISLEPDPYQIIRIRINYNKKAPINLEKNSQHVFSKHK